MNKLNEKLLVHTPVFDVVEKEIEGVGFKPVGLNCQDWVMVIVHDKCNAIFVKQTRWGLEDQTTEFPCGTVEPGEDPKVAAQRELLEETGIDLPLHKFEEIACFNPNPAYFNNKMHVYSVPIFDKLEEYFERNSKDLKLDENEDCAPFVDLLLNQKQNLISHGMGLIGWLLASSLN